MYALNLFNICYLSTKVFQIIALSFISLVFFFFFALTEKLSSEANVNNLFFIYLRILLLTSNLSTNFFFISPFFSVFLFSFCKNFLLVWFFCISEGNFSFSFFLFSYFVTLSSNFLDFYSFHRNTIKFLPLASVHF